MSRHTTLKIGGPARYYLEAREISGLRKALGLLRRRRIPYWIIGAGSNLLVRDGGLPGCALRLDGGFRWIRREGSRITAGGAAAIHELVSFACREGMAGPECLAGVPGTVGGAVAMNAGTHLGEIGDLLEEAEVLLPGGRIRRMSRQQLRLRYRGSSLPKNSVVLSVRLKTTPADPAEIRRRIADLLTRRSRTQPLGAPNCGCLFVNPPGDRAGRLLEAAGLKGFRVGRARLSPLHANFVENLGGATAADVERIIAKAKAEVWRKFRIRLKPEVRIIGRR